MTAFEVFAALLAFVLYVLAVYFHIVGPDEAEPDLSDTYGYIPNNKEQQ